jgi:cell division protein ZapA (FtsZ GTPase activity inhibitor)
MEDRELTINIIIDGMSYPLTVMASEEPYYRKAARIVNNKLSLYKDSFQGEGGVRVMTMVALYIACSMVTQNDEVGSAEVMQKVGELARLLDSTLKTKK